MEAGARERRPTALVLSAEQRRVVGWPVDGGHLLVVAGPGSGKTRTITERIGHLLAGGVPPEAIRAVTFSHNAAALLRHRLGRADVYAATFHGLCADLLREHGAAIGCGPPLRVYGEAERRAVLERAAAAAGVAVDPTDRRGSDRWFRSLGERIGRRKQLGLEPGALLPGDDRRADLAAAIDEAYCAALGEAGALDFDDLILRGTELLERDATTGDSVRRRLRYLFIDELHDVSPEQDRVIRQLAPPHPDGAAVMAVADEDQAIYGWRGADARATLRRFRRDYHPAELRLDHNHRSTPAIAAAAAWLLGRGPSAAQVDAGEPPHCRGFETPAGEADELVKVVERAVAAGYGHGDVAVLARTHAGLDAAEAALLRRGIPVWRQDPGRFFDQPDVQEALRYLDLVAALHDDCFEPALNWPRVLVDEVSMLRLRRLAAAEGISLCDLAHRIDDYADRIGPLTRAALREFLATIAAVLAPLIDQPLAEIVDRLLPLLDARRSPIPRIAREELHDLLDYLGRPLGPALEALAVVVAARRPIALRHGPNGDETAAALILHHALTAYLDAPAVLVGEDEPRPAGAFEIRLGQERPVSGDGFGLVARRARALDHSLSTVAWRLGQGLLMRFEPVVGEEERFVVLDLETGSPHPADAEPLEVAALPLTGPPLAARDGLFQSLVRPSGPTAIGSGASRLHGLTWRDVREAPPPAAVLPELLALLDGATVVGHCLESFDYPILRRLAVRAGLPPPAHPLLDSYKLARRLVPDLRGHGLLDLARAWRIADQQEHRAAGDVRLTAEVFRRLLARLRRERELDALAETLPLVAVGIAASGVPERVENATLAAAGARTAAWGQGAALLARWRAAVGAGEAAAGDAWLAARNRPVPDEDAAWERLRERWRSAVDAFREAGADDSLPAFLAYARLAQAVDFLPSGDPSRDGEPGRAAALDRVALLTVHAAKGKEWRLVCLLGAEDDQYPFWTSEDEAEDRRVLYVGMTRARERLLLFWTREREGRRRELSRFLAALPPGTIVHRP